VAIKYREIVLEALPEELEAALQLGYDWISKGSQEKAREVFAGMTRQALEGEEAEQVCLGLNKIGDVLMKLEDDRDALIAYGAGLEVRKGLSQRYPDNADWQGDLSWTQGRIGDLLLGLGDGPGALAAYREALEIRNALTQRDPDNTEWQRDLSISHDKIGDALVGQAKPRKAQAAYRAGLEIVETLARQDPENVQLQEGIAAFFLKLGSLDCLMTVKTRRQYVSRGRDILINLKTQGRYAVNDDFMGSLDDALKHNSTFNWNMARTALKVIGTGLLAAHIFHHPFIIEPGRVAIYFVIFCSVSILIVELIDPAIARVFRTQPTDYAAIGEKIADTDMRYILRLALLLPEEDGIFFGPLLWVGITPLTAGIAAAAFAAVHYPEFSIRSCVPKFVSLFCVAMVVLPHGIGSVMVGHLLVDTVAYTGLRLFASKPSP
jgi:predicted negative regulator of RcsB-dependent stress response